MTGSLTSFGALTAEGWEMACIPLQCLHVGVSHATQPTELRLFRQTFPSCRCSRFPKRKLRPSRCPGPNAGSSWTLLFLSHAAPASAVGLTPARWLRCGHTGLLARQPAHQTQSSLGSGCGTLPPGPQMSPTPFPTFYALAQNVTFSMRTSLTSYLKLQLSTVPTFCSPSPLPCFFSMAH